MEWKTKLAEKSKPLTDFLFFLAKRAQNDMIFRVASSLAYTSLIALVPLFAIGLAIFPPFRFLRPSAARWKSLSFKT